MIARIWRGVTPQNKSDQYFEYLMKTGIPDYRKTEGNLGVYVLRRTGDNRAEFLLISLWQSLADIRRFTGEDIEKAVYYPEDSEFLLELEPEVTHYEVLAQP
jgi:heme-degrading monooxygenase HmoA